MQDNNTPQDQVLDAQSETDGLEAIRRATAEALAESGLDEVKSESPAVAELLENVNETSSEEGNKVNGAEGSSTGAPAIVKKGVEPKGVEANPGMKRDGEEEEGATVKSDADGIAAPETRERKIGGEETGGEAEATKAAESTKAETGVEAGAETNAGAGVNTTEQKVAPQAAKPTEELEDKVLVEVLKKVRDAENVLVALSNDPSVDEMAAAIALSMTLDLIGKHATAIYSGKTPNVLEFLKPEETFEMNANVLQDFVIALNKDKADHLRYKIEGDFVKVYVTPYKSLISEGDLEFTRGDYNVDLVIALNVPAATELDAALREYGRIMHDATSVNITNEVPGKFGDVEWVDPKASSISEMVARLCTALVEDLDASVATALLTGLVAATDKFSNPATTPSVMMLAAKLMGQGANQQAVFQNISQKLEFRERNNDVEAMGEAPEVEAKRVDTSKLTVGHNGFSDSVEGGEMEKYVDLSSDAESGEVGGLGGSRQIVGMGDARDGLDYDGGGASVDDVLKAAEAVKNEQEGYLEATQGQGLGNDSGRRGGILGSVQSVLQSVINKNGAEGNEEGAPNPVVNEILQGLEKKEDGDSAVGVEGVAATIAGGGDAAGVGAGVETAVLNNGLPDYGKMIDEALNEKMPGEEAVTGVSESKNDVSAPAGNPVAFETQAVAQVETQTPVPTGIQVSDEAGVGVALPMPGGELGVPPAPVVADLNGLPQMPPVVDEAPSGEMNGGGVAPVAGVNGAVGGLQVQAPEVVAPQVQTVGLAVNGTTGLGTAGSGTPSVAGVVPETPNVGTAGAGVAVDPGQFQIPGQ